MAGVSTKEPNHRVSNPRRILVNIIRRVWGSWATRSLAVGPFATIVDVSVLLLMVKVLHRSTRVGAMMGVLVGSIFTFFANRFFAFRDRDPNVAPAAFKFALTTIGAMLLHGQLVVMLRDHWGIPVVISKILADLLVFSVGQLLMLRYVIFRKKRPPTTDKETSPFQGTDHSHTERYPPAA